MQLEDGHSCLSSFSQQATRNESAFSCYQLVRLVLRHSDEWGINHHYEHVEVVFAQQQPGS